MFRILIVFCVFLSFSRIEASPEIKPDRFMIAQFSRPVEQLVLKELTAYAFPVLEPLNLEKTLYKIGYESKNLSEVQALEILGKLPFFMFSQEDGPIDFRKTIPNDTQFYKQEKYMEKIRAMEAWDVSRSGVNRRGDTIVIAVVDDGLHVNHPDFQGNIWENHADIMGNGIDEDNNGYVDDHYGWNFMGNNNDISDSLPPFGYKGKHGTSVAGVIGARANNIIGISGIMWNVKLMIVNVADTGLFPNVFQSDVIKAYSYVLTQRKLYNATGGQKGAFVVAANSSWGRDGKFPHQAPIWCAMYDSLGKYGILNSIAVTNANGQVEILGDLPTLCPSIHVIAVGSSSLSDGFFSCGYSTTHVDLSAPGNSIYTANAYTRQNILNNNLYSSQSGTSFSAPMVAAAIGMLHAYACERVLDSIKSNPAGGNALIRKFILDGADVLDALSGKSVTSGRLNIKRSMQLMDKFCFGESVNMVPAEANIVLFPNPGNGHIQLLSDQLVSSVECYDLTGKLLSSHFDGEELVLDHVENGVYFIRVTIGEQVLTYKYVKTDGF